MRSRLVFALIVALCSVGSPALHADEPPVKKILIVTQGTSDLKNYAMGDGRQLAMLMGHFSTVTTVKGVADYHSGELNYYDFTFYVGFEVHNQVPSKFLDDVYGTSKPVIWLSTGMPDFAKRYDLKKRFGFTVTGIDSTTKYDQIRANKATFTKGEPQLGIIQITNPSIAKVLGHAYSTTKHREAPYIVKAGNLTYFGDSPFAYAVPGDHYILFADMLHDILGEQHDESHQAMIRIEDVSVYDDPNSLREIADILSSRGIPFMVGVIPFFVDPGEGTRLSLSDKPDLVDALQYMVRNGGTIVMHGVTHQYKGVTAADFEFWDESTNQPIKGETEDAIAKKLELGIQEFMKNGLYPLVWETPHYTASFKLYRTVAKYFSSACEQRLALEDADFSQFFPYIIKKDLFGQTIYPEDLGYVPLNPDKKISEGYVDELIKNAKSHLYVRDGVATAFFHSFLDLDLLKRLADGLQGLGYSFLDMREQTHWVKTPDRVILCGSQTYTINLKDQYLVEAYYDRTGEVKQRIISPKRIYGAITKSITLQPGEFYKAEPTEFREREETFFEKVSNTAEKVFDNLFPSDENWRPMRPTILWNHFARGALYNDQASFASVFRSVNVALDTVFLGQPINLEGRNLLVVPASIADSLKKDDIHAIVRFVNGGGNIILDSKTDLAGEFGIVFAQTQLRVMRIRDKMFPEEQITWPYPELVSKFELDNIDKIFAVDEITEAPMVIGKKVGKGKVLFINSRFDPLSQEGYSHYPYLIEYIRRFFQLRPIVRLEQLEVYFDPGFRHAYSVENLVRTWVNNGIRVVHVAGWHQYPKYTYDYERLIRLAHANGILVYAWIEPPQVSQMFWNNHPNWREKNIKGEDIRPSWRYPVALTDTACVAAMIHEYTTLLHSYDFDGVNLAELSFDAGRGFDDPRLFTPAHPSARAELKRKYNIDLNAVFDPESPYYWKLNPTVREVVVSYRIQKLHDVYEKLLHELAAVAAQKQGFTIIVTAFDSFGSPELREYLGVDMGSIISLQKKYGFTLQVEDPQTKWSSDPHRYISIGRTYAALLGDSSKLMLDLNILSFRNKDAVIPFPTLIQTGTESFHLIHAASIGAPHVTIYCEATVNPQDMAFLSNALASAVRYRETPSGMSVNAPYSFIVRMPKDIARMNLDGTPLPMFRNNRFLIPAGEHLLTINPQAVGSFSTSELQTRILSTTGNLLSFSYGLRDVDVEYQSDTRMLISLSNVPTAVTVDGQSYQSTTMKGNDCYSIFLPPGRHEARIVTGDQFSYGVSVTSLWSSTAIALFGAGAVVLLVLMYIGLKFVKRTAEPKRA